MFLSLFICVASNLVAVFTVPFSLNLLLGFGSQIDLPVMTMLKSLVLLVLLPTVVGQVCRIKIKDRLEAGKPYFSFFSQLVVLLIILNALSTSAGPLRRLGVGIVGMVMFILVLHVVVLVINFGVARALKLDRASTAAFTIHTSQKTLTITFVIWSSYFAEFALGLIPAVSYHLVQVIFDSFVARRFKKAACGAGAAAL